MLSKIMTTLLRLVIRFIWEMSSHTKGLEGIPNAKRENRYVSYVISMLRYVIQRQ